MSFTLVSLIGRFTLRLFVHPQIPATILAELVQYARANPGKLSYAHSALMEAVAAAQLAKSGGINMLRVPYKGGASVITDLVAGRVQLGFMPASVITPRVREGRLRAPVTLLPVRSPAIRDGPTMVEAGYPAATATP